MSSILQSSSYVSDTTSLVSPCRGMEIAECYCCGESPREQAWDLKRCDGTTGTGMTNINCRDVTVGPLTCLLHLYFWLLLSLSMHLHAQCTVAAEGAFFFSFAFTYEGLL